jgi:hypothetical protein
MVGQDESPVSRVTPLTRQTAFTYADTHPLVFDRFLADKYGVHWLVWEPETLWATITKDFSLKSGISNHARSGIQSVKTIHAVDAFFLDWQATQWCTQGLDGVPPDFEVLQESTPGQIMHAVTCAQRLRGPMPYADEVQSWMAACFLNNGLVYAPPPVEFIQDEIAETQAKCKKCDNVEWAVGLTECPNCGADKDQLEISPKYEWKDVQEMWQIVKNADADDVVLRENRLGVQVARLFVARDHVREQMAKLDEQLKELGYGGAGRP